MVYELSKFIVVRLFIGDSRSNQVPGLAALHVLFLRQHNNFAAKLSILNPVWEDEKLYQEVRRIVVAIVQPITYNEFLPEILESATLDAYGLTPQTTSYSGSYDGKVNPSITNEFATATYRMGHSLIQPTVKYLHNNVHIHGDCLLINCFLFCL